MRPLQSYGRGADAVRSGKSESVANTFVRRRDAEEWAIDVERSIDRDGGGLDARMRPLQARDLRGHGTVAGLRPAHYHV